MDALFENIKSTHRALDLLKKFEGLNLPGLGIQEKYQRILSHYARDIEMVGRLYQKNKTDPPVDRDLPPIAGKITWSRQLFRRVQMPMEAFVKHQNILNTIEAKKIIKNYNKLAKTLLEFEVLYHRGWLRQMEAVKSGLHASILVKNPETSQLLVNFDPNILVLIRETECMIRLGLEIPPTAKFLKARQAGLKENFNNLGVSIFITL